MKKIIVPILLGLFIGNLFFNITPAQAETETGIIQYPVISVPPTGLPVYDVGVNTQKTMKEVSTFAWSSITSAIKKAATKTYSSLLRRYLNQIAQETAVYVANGSKGQKPSFYQWTWKSFSQDLADKAAGAYLENFFQAVQEGDQQSSTRTKSVTCGVNTIKIKFYTKTSDNNNSNDFSISYAANSDNTYVEDISSLSIASQIDSTCYDKIDAAMEELQNGGGETIENWNNGANLDKYLGKDFDICQPSSMMVAFKIGLGIDDANTKDTEDLCSATQIFKNWDKAIQDSVKDQTAYLKNVQNYFDPRANDIGIAMSLMSKKGTYVQTEVSAAEAQRTEDKGAVRNTNAGGKLIELPGNFQINLENVKFLQSSALMSQTGDAFIDAANVFVSVLSNKLYDKAMQRLMKLLADQDDDNKTTNTKLLDFYSSANIGQAESEALLAPITDMTFTSGHDIDLLNNLASCPDPNKPGAMNCVVNNNFVQAISQELTVGQALKKKLINGNANFGSSKLESNNLETGDINWRSMKILRKYRILPVSWEVAAEIINANGYNQGKTITIADMIGCYSLNDEYDTGYNIDWCKGLIDPNWPLKAPKSYCAKSGFGNQVDYMDILSEDQAATGTSPAILSTVNLLRTSNYCADEQSCIKEGANNSCELYGYCTEDRRTWKFPSNTCDANYNTCQTYTNTAGQKTSYLANTLDFSSCNTDNSGCAGYCTKYDYSNQTFTCAPNTTTDKYYLSGKAESCSASEAGCQQLIRLKNNGGVNLLFNGDFEFSTAGATANSGKLDNWNIYYTAGTAVIVTSSDKVYAGEKALKIAAGGSRGIVSFDWSNANQSSLPKNFLMRPGVSYTLSAYVYNVSGDPVYLAIGNSNGGTDINGALWAKSSSTQTGAWEKVSVTLNNDQYYNANSFVITKTGSGNFYVDNIMFEVASQGNQGYKKYRETAYTYEKLTPKDLDSLCYEQIGTGRRLKNNAPAECRNYARTCLAQEVDCKMFTNKNSGDNIPAKTNLQNYCPSSCVNFASFWQEPTNFNNGQEKSLIPSKAVTCSSANVGCSEFTNLSNDSGAETREYYSYLRQCVKPEEPNANCSEFYTWENSENSGLQLSSHTLRADSNGAPKLTETTRLCTANSLNINHSDYDPDCREVRNQAGDIFYVAYSKTITCSANCQTYRLSENNVVTNITSAASCNLINGNWINNRAECVVCKNGGTWDETHQRCIYRGLPAESSSCSASQNGCRRYSGTGSANWRLVTNFSFDNNSIEGWDNVSVQADTFRSKGSSITTLSNYSQVSLDNLGIEKGKKYRLQFFAKPQSSNAQINSISIYNTNSSSVLSTLGSTTTLNSGWNFYTIAASSTIDVDVPASGVVLRFNHTGSYSLDEIRLIEVSDEYYLLKDSLNVPTECNRDYNGTPSPGFMLGCQAYTDNDNNTHFLHGFSDICQESAVGCEMMINTNNYTNHYYPFTPSGSTDEISTTTADEVIYAIYDQDKLCSSADKGCQLLGKEKSYTSQSVYENTYLKFDPDRYRTDAISPIMCASSEVGCQTWVGEINGLSYFKDPGDQLCEWRAKSDNSGFAWFKRPVKQCTESSIYCSTNKDCASISSTSQCILQPATSTCPVNTLPDRTIGLAEIVQQPTTDTAGNNWTGLCPSTQSGCTEYVDPISRTGENLVKNFNSSTLTSVELEPFTAYTVLAKADSGNTITINWYVPSTPIWLLDDNNRLIATSSSATNPKALVLDKTSSNNANYDANGNYNSFTFISGARSELKIPANTNLKNLAVRKTILSYQINKNLSSTECTDGKTEYASGCLLFNERGYQQGNYSKLNLNTNLTENDLSGVSPQADPSTNNANRLIKVSPSRVCSKWLECTTYSVTKLDNGDNKKICTDFGLCDKLDPYNTCSHFVEVSTTTNQTYNTNITASQMNNLTGYSRVGKQNNQYTNDLLNIAAMTEVGKNIAEDLNGSFESVTGKLTTIDDGSQDYSSYRATDWMYQNYSKIIVSPQHAIQTDSSFNNDYLAPDGNNFLRITTINYSTTTVPNYYGYVKNTRYLKVDSQTEYTLSASVRTNSGSAGFKIWEYTCTNPTSTNNYCRPNGASHNITNSKSNIVSNNKWSSHNLNFITKPDTSYILIELDAFTKNGVAYFDNVKLTPNLAYRRNNSNNANELLAPTCRLYPEGNSLSCDYISPSNKSIRKKGLLGYCLEYDPANNQNCLLWYPLDKIGADPIEEGVGYVGKRPLYYCMEASSTLQLEYRHAFQLNRTNDCNGCGCTGSCPANYQNWRCFGSGNNNDQRRMCHPNSSNNLIIQTGFESAVGSGINNHEEPNPRHENDGWYLYDGNLVDYTSFDTEPIGYYLSEENLGSLAQFFCQKYFNGSWNTDDKTCYTQNRTKMLITKEIYRDQFGFVVTTDNNEVPSSPPIYCTKFARVVDNAGNNIFWSDRVKENSTYQMPCYIPGVGNSNCLFDQSSIPFASIAYPAGAGNNPESWDGIIADQSPDQQPLLYEAAANGIHLGKIYSTDTNNQKHPRYLFAKSYGSYQWQFDTNKGGSGGHDYFADSGQYIAGGVTAWDVPTSTCSGSNGTRPTGNSTASYCYINPIISNIKVNGRSVINNELIEFEEATLNLALAFNSKVDANQQPLKTINIDWGDDTSYDYTGNFLDRPNLDAPHLFTHRYTCALDADNTCHINNIIITIKDNWSRSTEFRIKIKPRNAAMESLMNSMNTAQTELIN